MALQVVSDPEASRCLTQLRDLSLRPNIVRSLVGKMTAALAKHAMKQSLEGEQIAVIVILRSGLAMVDAFLDALPEDVNTVIYHLGLFREKQTLRPIEYYNKLPPKDAKIKRAYILDPLVATGGTARAAIDILRDWGVDHVTLLSLLGSEQGLQYVANTWPEHMDIVVGAVDNGLDNQGYVSPGVGDIGDRLFGTALG